MTSGSRRTRRLQASRSGDGAIRRTRRSACSGLRPQGARAHRLGTTRGHGRLRAPAERCQV